MAKRKATAGPRPQSEWTLWHYHREVTKLRTNAAVIMNTVLQRHAESLDRLENPGKSDVEERGVRGEYFRALLLVEASALFVREPDLVEQLLSNHLKAREAGRGNGEYPVARERSWRQ